MFYHLNSPFHLTLVQFLQEQRAEREKDRKRYVTGVTIDLDPERKSAYEQTANMFRVVHLQARLNIPFKNHLLLVAAMKQSGARLGIHSFTHTGDRMITTSIGKHMHRNLVAYLSELNLPLSIVVDGKSMR